MDGSFWEYIKKTGIFLICAESILHFAPGGSYQKYIKLLIGMMVLAQFLLPIKALVMGQEGAVLEQQIGEFKQLLESSAANLPMIEFTGDTNGKTFETGVAEEIKSRFNSIAAASGYHIEEIVIDKIIYVIVKKEINQNNMNIGTEKQAETIEGEGKIGVKGRINIKPIIIERDSTAHVEDERQRENTPELENLRQQFCVELGTDERYLEVVACD